MIVVFLYSTTAVCKTHTKKKNLIYLYTEIGFPNSLLNNNKNLINARKFVYL